MVQILYLVIVCSVVATVVEGMRPGLDRIANCGNYELYGAVREKCSCYEGEIMWQVDEGWPFRCMTQDNYKNIVRPVCSKGCPANAACVANNVCECGQGWLMSKDKKKCEAVCSVGCPPNSVCDSPDVCTCNDGYDQLINGGCVIQDKRFKKFGL